MVKVRLIGDIHSSTHDWIYLVNDGCPSIVLGDVGYGFFQKEWGRHMEKHFPNAKAFLGNHDNPEEGYKYKTVLRAGVHPDFPDVFIVPGAWSIDWEWRTPGKNWWPEEELSQEELNQLVELYKQVKPRVVLSHDCPAPAFQRMFAEDPTFKGYGGKKDYYPTRTGDALSCMFDAWKPEAWYCGHYHHPTEATIDGTYFRCLGICEAVEVEL